MLNMAEIPESALEKEIPKWVKNKIKDASKLFFKFEREITPQYFEFDSKRTDLPLYRKLEEKVEVEIEILWKTEHYKECSIKKYIEWDIEKNDFKKIWKEEDTREENLMIHVKTLYGWNSISKMLEYVEFRNSRTRETIYREEIINELHTILNRATNRKFFSRYRPKDKVAKTQVTVNT